MGQILEICSQVFRGHENMTKVAMISGSFEIPSGSDQGNISERQHSNNWSGRPRVRFIGNEPDARRAATFVLSISNMFTVHGREV